jgi:hypothetical protein
MHGYLNIFQLHFFPFWNWNLTEQKQKFLGNTDERAEEKQNTVQSPSITIPPSPSFSLPTPEKTKNEEEKRRREKEWRGFDGTGNRPLGNWRVSGLGGGKCVCYCEFGRQGRRRRWNF